MPIARPPNHFPQLAKLLDRDLVRSPTRVHPPLLLRRRVGAVRHAVRHAVRSVSCQLLLLELLLLLLMLLLQLLLLLLMLLMQLLLLQLLLLLELLLLLLLLRCGREGALLLQGERCLKDQLGRLVAV